MELNKVLIGKWESKQGKSYYELYRDELGFTMRGDWCYSNLGDRAKTEVEAINFVENVIKQNNQRLKRTK